MILRFLEFFLPLNRAVTISLIFGHLVKFTASISYSSILYLEEFLNVFKIPNFKKSV